jgi:hypothetical protein
VLRIISRRTRDVRYFTEDPALELDGLRAGPAGWWMRGGGDTSDPHVVGGVLDTTARASVVGYDMVFAAPRPVSVVLALDEATAPALIAAHRRSVVAAMTYLEDHALSVRTHLAKERYDFAARWAEVVSFTHGVNRHGEPHLHDHVLVGARPACEDTVLDRRSLLAHAPAADALYLASLRHELNARTTWRAWRSFYGNEHVVGVDEGYRVLWGGHHDDRGEKLHWSREDAVRAWRGDLARYVAEVAPVAPQRSFDEHAYGGAFEGLVRVTRRDVVEAWAHASVFGARARDVEGDVSRVAPELSRERGLGESSISVARARSYALSRERVERAWPTDLGVLQRARGSREISERSR